MKKLICIALALVMTLALSVTCFAEVTGDKVGLKTGENATNNVTATYAATANDESAVYYVDVTFGAMAFTYTDAAKTWNPSTHKYELQGAEGAWTCADGANKITVTNHSNKGVTATLSYAAANDYDDVEGNFDKTTLNIGDATGGSAVSEEAYLTLDGALASGSGVTVGTVTVAIAAAAQ